MPHFAGFALKEKPVEFHVGEKVPLDRIIEVGPKLNYLYFSSEEFSFSGKAKKLKDHLMPIGVEYERLYYIDLSHYNTMNEIEEELQKSFAKLKNRNGQTAYLRMFATTKQLSYPYLVSEPFSDFLTDLSLSTYLIFNHSEQKDNLYHGRELNFTAKDIPIFFEKIDEITETYNEVLDILQCCIPHFEHRDEGTAGYEANQRFKNYLRLLQTDKTTIPPDFKDLKNQVSPKGFFSKLFRSR